MEAIFSRHHLESAQLEIRQTFLQPGYAHAPCLCLTTFRLFPCQKHFEPKETNRQGTVTILSWRDRQALPPVSFGVHRALKQTDAAKENPSDNTGGPDSLSWALAVFFHFFNDKNNIFCIFYHVNLTGG